MISLHASEYEQLWQTNRRSKLGSYGSYICTMHTHILALAHTYVFYNNDDSHSLIHSLQNELDQNQIKLPKKENNILMCYVNLTSTVKNP